MASRTRQARVYGGSGEATGGLWEPQGNFPLPGASVLWGTPISLLMRPFVLLLCALALGACRSTALAPPVSPDAARVDAGVRAVLDAQVEAWNAGSVRGFMDGYVHTDSLVFLSGGSVRRGWEEALYAYVRSYPDGAAMGTLTFSDLTVRPLGPGWALAWGRWRLDRTDDAPGGLFSLLLTETASGWRIVHDHTSAE